MSMPTTPEIIVMVLICAVLVYVILNLPND